MQAVGEDVTFLVNNAGIMPAKPFLNLTKVEKKCAETWKLSLNASMPLFVNLRAVWQH